MNAILITFVNPPTREQPRTIWTNVYHYAFSYSKTTLTMVWTNTQTTAFFTANDQMALPDRTYQKLADEGITGATDLIDFTGESIK